MQDNITSLLKAIADPTRREIFHALVVAATSLPIMQVATNFNISRQGVTKHIKILENAGLVTITAQGRERFCAATPTPLREIDKWISTYDKFWDNSLNNLESFLDKS